MRFLRQSIIGFFFTALSLGLLIWAGQLVRDAIQTSMADERAAPPARERVFAVNVLEAKPQREVPELQTFGEIASRRTLELRAAVSGRVIFLAEGFEEGGKVQKGDVLVRIDPVDAEAAVARAQSDMADARAEGRDAARVLVIAGDELIAAQEQARLRDQAFTRQKDLAARGVATAAATEAAELAASSAKQAVLARRQAIAQAEARVDQAATGEARVNIALEEAQRRLAETVVTAPFDGSLSATNVVEGRLVTTNERLAALIDPDDLEVSFRVSTAQYARLLGEDGTILNADTRVTLEVAGFDLEALGQVSRASAATGEGQTGRLIFAALGRAAGFKPGDFVTVKVQEPALENVVRLPASAVDASNTVLVLGEENRLESIDITLLRRQGDEVLVRGPIEGRNVVKARSPLLGAGIAVKPLIRPDTSKTISPKAPEMVALSDERRAKIVAFITNNKRIPKDRKEMILARLAEPEVPAKMVERIESRMGG